ncbi:MAG: radical SAM protein [Pseudomonadota bacterium]|nr:radical SAM protein [Pseudomonadota bacterium]
MTDLYLLAINLTRRCNLACAHCYMDTGTRAQGGTDELSTREVEALLDQVADRSTDTMVVLTGGEPLLRHDLEALVSHGSVLGLTMVVGTNGVLLDEARAASLKQAGALGMGISLDSLDPAFHDNFRGCPGSWEKTLSGIEACRRLELPFQVHFSVTEANAGEVPAMIAFARSVGAHLLNVFFLVCTGRGESMSDITSATYERVLEQLVEAQERSDGLMVRARCAPHFKRIAYQRNPESPLTRAQGYEGGGCLAGIHYCRVTPEGGITACPYIPDEEGSIRDTPFWAIWDASPTFGDLRAPRLRGKCGDCEFQRLCGGCRARPLALGQGLMDADPWCSYQPRSGPIIEPLTEASAVDTAWDPEAEQRLSRVPGFLRKMVKKRAEDYVREHGRRRVTTEDMAVLAQRRFGAGMPSRPGAQLRSIAEAGTAPIQNDPDLAWTSEARQHLESLPVFLREGVRQVAEDVARSEGRLEVNMRLLTRLEEEDEPGRRMRWSTAAEDALEQILDPKAPQVRLFMQATLEAAAEQEAKRRKSPTVDAEDVERFADEQMAGVEWEPDALARVRSAPELVRGGIKKAAEFNARREGLARIASNDLTRFRNRAMMRAVRRMKGFGMSELSFDAYEVAKERVPRLKDNDQGAKRFAAIRDYVESHQDPDGGGLGALDRDMIERMKAELKK